MESSFIKKTATDKKEAFYRKRGWQIFLSVLGLVLILSISYVGYVIASGMKTFSNGIGSTQSIIKSIQGKTILKGEDSDRVNVLVLGMGGANHPGGTLSDSMILMSIEPKENKIALLNIPRDLLISIPGHGDDKINAAFADGYNEYRAKNCAKKTNTTCNSEALSAGADLSRTTVANLTGLSIDYSVSMDFSGFEKIINQLGGVDVYVDKAIYDPYFPDDQMQGYAPYSISVGQKHLDGEAALKYARSRETTSDFDRAARQQKILMAVKEKATTLQVLTNPKKIADLISVLGDSVKTNMTLAETTSLAGEITRVDKNSIITKVMTTASDSILENYTADNTYYLRPKGGDYSQIKRIAQKIFDPSVEGVASVKVENGSSTVGVAGDFGKILQDNIDFKMTTISTASVKYAKSQIQDFSGGTKPTALAELKTLLPGATVVVKPTGNSAVDFIVIIGNDYQ